MEAVGPCSVYVRRCEGKGVRDDIKVSVGAGRRVMLGRVGLEMTGR